MKKIMTCLFILIPFEVLTFPASDASVSPSGNACRYYTTSGLYYGYTGQRGFIYYFRPIVNSEKYVYVLKQRNGEYIYWNKDGIIHLKGYLSKSQIYNERKVIREAMDDLHDGCMDGAIKIEEKQLSDQRKARIQEEIKEEQENYKEEQKEKLNKEKELKQENISANQSKQIYLLKSCLSGYYKPYSGYPQKIKIINNNEARLSNYLSEAQSIYSSAVATLRGESPGWAYAYAEKQANEYPQIIKRVEARIAHDNSERTSIINQLDDAKSGALQSCFHESIEPLVSQSDSEDINNGYFDSLTKSIN